MQLDPDEVTLSVKWWWHTFGRWLIPFLVNIQNTFVQSPARRQIQSKSETNLKPQMPIGRCCLNTFLRLVFIILSSDWSPLADVWGRVQSLAEGRQQWGQSEAIRGWLGQAASLPHWRPGQGQRSRIRPLLWQVSSENNTGLWFDNEKSEKVKAREHPSIAPAHFLNFISWVAVLSCDIL